jgi:hypothetical protein
MQPPSHLDHFVERLGSLGCSLRVEDEMVAVPARTTEAVGQPLDGLDRFQF